MAELAFNPGLESPFVRISRKLMAYHCSGSDTVLGDVNVGGSIVILLIIGFVVGFGLAWLIFWRRQRKQVLLELEYRQRCAESKKQDLPDVGAMVQSAAAPVLVTPVSAKGESRLPATAATLASGPLALGVRDSQALPTKAPPQRTGSGNPFAGVEPYNVVRNPTSSLDASPRLPAGPLARSAVSRTVSGGVEMQASASGLIPAMRPADKEQQQGRQQQPEAPAAGLGGEAMHARSETVVINPLGPSAGTGVTPASDLGAALARVALAQEERQRAAAPAKAAASEPAIARTASGNPFTDPKQAHKQELLEQVRSDAYDEQDLDPEWAELLQELDQRMAAAGKQALSSKERAVAIRSLIVATASQSAEAALAKAMADVEIHRRTQQYLQQ